MEENEYKIEFVPEVKPPKGFSVAGFVCGLIGMVLILACCCCGGWVPGVLGVLGIVFGILGLTQHQDKRTLAILGIVFGGVAVLFSLICIVGTLTASSGDILRLLAPLYEMMGVNTDELMDLINSGATQEEISQFLEEQLGNVSSAV